MQAHFFVVHVEWQQVVQANLTLHYKYAYKTECMHTITILIPISIVRDIVTATTVSVSSSFPQLVSS